LAEIARRGWVAITHDARIRYKPNELAAIKRHNARLIVVIGKAPYPALAQSFVNTRVAITAVLPLRRAQTAVSESVLEGRIDDAHPTGTSTSAAPIKAP